MPEPRSTHNPQVKRLRLLARTPSARREQGAYVIEGPTLVADALGAGVVLDVAFVEGDAVGSLVERLAAAGVTVFDVGPGGLRGIVATTTPQPIAAIARRGVQPVDLAPDLVVVLVDVGDPGNVGTALRTAEAAGAGLVVCCGATADPWSPKAVRASAGAVFRVPVQTGVEVGPTLAALGRRRVTRLATTVADGTAYDQVDLTGPVALVLGNEARGLALGGGRELDGLVDHAVTIPMAGRTESLNVAMATAILAFEVRRQRRAAATAPAPGGPPGTDLPSAGLDGIVRRP